jgi:hypothetical protein
LNVPCGVIAGATQITFLIMNSYFYIKNNEIPIQV